MPAMITCIMNEREIDIQEALKLRDLADNRGVDREDYFCIECNQPVRAHNSGGGASAHFEHLERNQQCSLIHK